MGQMTFEETMHGIMEALVDAGFENVSTSATLSTEYGELSFFGDEAGRLLAIIQHGLKALDR
jgi:hypothetical protein